MKFPIKKALLVTALLSEYLQSQGQVHFTIRLRMKNKSKNDSITVAYGFDTCNKFFQYIPDNWQLIPVKDKKPYQRDWQQTPISKQEILQSISSGRANGYGLLTGMLSDHALAIDFDGSTARAKYIELYGEPPHTVEWSSGKPGRSQIALRIPEKYRSQLKTFTRISIHTGEREQLEFRFNRCQSVLPGSRHPETGGYFWINSPEDTAVAECPEAICKQLIKHAQSEGRVAATKAARNAALNGFVSANPLSGLLPFLPYLEQDDRASNRYRCPAHNGVSTTSLHVFETGNAHCFNGCSYQEVLEAAKEKAVTAGWKPEETVRRAGYNSVVERLKLAFRVAQEKRPLPAAVFEDIDISNDNIPFDNIFLWNRDNLASKLRAAFSIKKIVHLKGAPGSGKTTTVSSFTPSQFGVSRFWMVDNNYRNPSNPDLAEWQELEGRRGPLTLTNGATPRRRIARQGEVQVSPENCKRHETMQALNSLNIPDSNTFETLCKGCPFLSECSKTKGMFLHDRQKSLEATKIRCAPGTMPRSGNHDYTSDLIFVEEAEVTLKPQKSFDFTASDIEKAITYLVRNDSELFKETQEFLFRVLSLVDGEVKQSRYGVSHKQVCDLMGEPLSHETLIKLIQAFEPDLNSVTQLEDGTDWADIPQRYRAMGSDSEFAEKVKQQIFKQWIDDFCSAVYGGKGTVTARFDTLTVTLRDDSILDPLKAARNLTCIDATLDTAELAEMLGVSINDIAVFEFEEDTGELPENVKRYHLPELGVNGRNRSEIRDNANELIKNAIDAKYGVKNVVHFDWSDKLNGRSNAAGHYTADSRGANDYMAKKVITYTIPRPNINAVLSDYAILKGRVPDMESDEFKNFYRNKVKIAIAQLEGRLRAQHRGNEKQLLLFALGDTTNLMLGAEPLYIADVCPDACITQKQRWFKAAQDSLTELLAKGRDIASVTWKHLKEYLPQIADRTLQRWLSELKNIIVTGLLEQYNPVAKADQEALNKHAELVLTALNGYTAALPEEKRDYIMYFLWRIWPIPMSQLRHIWKNLDFEAQKLFNWLVYHTFSEQELAQI